MHRITQDHIQYVQSNGKSIRQHAISRFHLDNDYHIDALTILGSYWCRIG